MTSEPVNPIRVTKLEAVRRQLATAVQLYFEDGDELAVHTLAAAARQVLTDLNRRAGGKPMPVSEGSLDLIKPELRSEFRKSIFASENFLKHADRDPDAELLFSPKQTEFFLVESCMKFEELAGNTTPMFDAFVAWFGIANGSIVSKERHAEAMAKYPENFVGRKAAFYRYAREGHARIVAQRKTDSTDTNTDTR